MTATRRDLIKTAIAGSSSFVLARLLPACNQEEMPTTPNSDTLPLNIPRTFDGGTLRAQRVNVELRPGLSREAWTLGGSFPAPTIRVRKGDTFSAAFQNDLDEPTNVHWHGITAPADMDGHPRDAVAPGASKTYTFPILDRAGTYWYHPHPHGDTAKQVYLGMAGFFIVEDDDEAALDLPRGELDVPLLIQDKRFAGETLAYEPSMADIADGYLGETIFVNGVPNAHFDVSSSVYRFRVLNGSNARTFKLELSDARPMQVIATDGGLLDAPIAANEVWLSPAERVEVLVDFSRDPLDSSLVLLSESFMVGDPGGHAGHGGGGAGVVRQGARLQLLRFDVKRAGGNAFTMPSTLVPIDRLDRALAVRTRPFELTMRHEATSGLHVINGKVFEMERIDETIALSDLEVWRVESKDSAAIHPMHVHGAQFQVLSRTPGRSFPTDRGWKDTVLVFPMETVELAVRFTQYRGLYLFHCHTLEHEDDGMMLNVDVT